MIRTDDVAKHLARRAALAALCTIPFCPITPAEEELLTTLAGHDEWHARWAERVRELLPWPWVVNRRLLYINMRREVRRLGLRNAPFTELPAGIGRWFD